MLKKVEPNGTRDDTALEDESPFFIDEAKEEQKLASKGNYIKPKGSYVGQQNRYNNSVNSHNMQSQNGYNLTRNTHSFGSFQKLTQYSNTSFLDASSNASHNYGPRLNMYGQMSSSHVPRYRSVSRCSSSSTSSREHNDSLKKTKLCDHWKKSGHCSFGESCWYAHGEYDLRKTAYYNNSPPRGKGATMEEAAKAKKDVDTKEGDDRDSSARLPSSASVSLKTMMEPGKVGSKRTTTNVKGLTVNIPANITTNHEDKGSMPLSPAQERWISMSVGSNSNAEKIGKETSKSDDTVTTGSSTSTIVVGKDEEFMRRNEHSMNFNQNGKMTRDFEFGQEPYLVRMDNPSDYPMPNSRVPAQMQRMPHTTQTYTNPVFMNRSYGRGPQPRPNMMVPFGGQNPNAAKMSRSSTGYPSAAPPYSYPPPSMTHRAPNMGAFGPNIPDNMSYGSEKHLPPTNTYSHLADEIYRRQKAMESDKNHLRYMAESIGGRHGYPNMHENRRRQQEEEAMMMKQIHMEKMARSMSTSDTHYETPPWKYDGRRGMSVPPPSHAHSHVPPPSSFQSNRQAAAMIMQQRMHHHQQQQNQQAHHHHSQPHLHPPPPPQPQHHQSFSVPPPNMNHDCYCGSRSLNSNEAANHGLVPFDFDMTSIPAGLAPPPRNFESLLPDDKAFSIWLDLKPRKEDALECDSTNSLTKKMAALRSQKVPISEPEDPKKANSQKTSTTQSETESVSPVLSLYDLLSSENLFEHETKKPRKKKTFDFDFLEAVESRGTLTPSSSSHLYVDDSKTPFFEEKKMDKLTKCRISPPPMTDNEICYFFATGGMCPLGESCILTHEKENEEIGM